MPDFSLVPVEHQPDFSDVSLVPVDHDPFGADGVTRPVQQTQTPTQTAPAQTQPAHALPRSPSQQPATGAEVAQSNIGMPGADSRSTNEGESWDPDAENNGRAVTAQPNQTVPISQSGKLPVDPERLRQFGELKTATYTPTQQIGNFAADALMGLGVKPYFANDLKSRVGDLLGLTPLGVVGSAHDLIDAKRRDDLPGVLEAAAGMIPGAKGVARGLAADAFDRHHPWPKYLGGAVKQELVRLPRSLHVEFHRRLDKDVPKQLGTAHYESLSPTKRQEALQALAEQTKKFDADYGTKLYDALLKNGFPAP